MRLTIQSKQDSQTGRWRAEIPELDILIPDAENPEEASKQAQIRALQFLALKLEKGWATPEEIALIEFQRA